MDGSLRPLVGGSSGRSDPALARAAASAGSGRVGLIPSSELPWSKTIVWCMFEKDAQAAASFVDRAVAGANSRVPLDPSDSDGVAVSRTRF